MDPDLTEIAAGVVIPVRVVPRAGRTALDGVVDGALRVRLAVAPVEGEANRALRDFLARLLGLPKTSVEIISGQRGRQKRVLARGLTAAEARARLGGSLSGRP